MSVLIPTARPSAAILPLASQSGVEPGQLLILRGVSYESYVAMADAIVDRPGVRFTYHEGTLEIMTTSNQHEDYKNRLNRLLSVVFEELNQPFITGGNQTLRDEELAQGFEPDECYWIAHWEQVREPYFLWHPEHQPPPDLVFEIEVSRTAINKLDILAAYRVPEVWRFDGTTLKVHLLQPEGGYREVEASSIIPHLPIADLPQFIGANGERENLAFTRAVRGWVRQWASV